MIEYKYIIDTYSPTYVQYLKPFWAYIPFIKRLYKEPPKKNSAWLIEQSNGWFCYISPKTALDWNIDINKTYYSKGNEDENNNT